MKLFHKQNKVRDGILFNHPVVSTEISVFNKSDFSRRWMYRGIIVNPTITIDDGKIYFFETRNLKARPDTDGTLGLDVIRKNLFLISLGMDFTATHVARKAFKAKSTQSGVNRGVTHSNIVTAL